MKRTKKEWLNLFDRWVSTMNALEKAGESMFYTGSVYVSGNYFSLSFKVDWYEQDKENRYELEVKNDEEVDETIVTAIGNLLKSKKEAVIKANRKKIDELERSVDELERENAALEEE